MHAEDVKEEAYLRLMKIIAESDHKLTQRDLAKRAGISLGKTNYWISEMVKDGFITASRLSSGGTRSGYHYQITLKGAEEKFHLIIHLLSRKIREYDRLGKEIEELNRLVNQTD